MRGGSEASIPAGDVLAPSGRMLLAAEIGVGGSHGTGQQLASSADGK